MTDLARRTILAIVKSDTREFVTIEVCDTEEELAAAHADIRAGYTCEVFELNPALDADARPVLPGWGEMSDLDKGAALLHLHKREWEGAEYAESDYPARYFDDPRLTALLPVAASRHAVSVDPGESEPLAERDRLYDLALTADRARPLPPEGACADHLIIGCEDCPAGKPCPECGSLLAGSHRDGCPVGGRA